MKLNSIALIVNLLKLQKSIFSTNQDQNTEKPIMKLDTLYNNDGKLKKISDR